MANNPKRRGDAFELRVKRELERMGHRWVFAGSPSEPGADLLLLCCGQIVEVKKQAWSDLPSPKRRQAALMGDLYRARGIPHQIVCGAPAPKMRWLVGGRKGDLEGEWQASILYEGVLPSIRACGGRLRTGSGPVPVPLPAPEEREAE